MSREPPAVCPDTETLLAFVEGFSGDKKHEAIARHVADCDDCCRAIAALSGSGGPTPSGAGGEFGDELSVGERVGRYEVLGRVGEGRRGVVYAAHDPELDRRVALRLLRREQGGGLFQHQIEARLRREAMAMARLQHPNVAGVYDVGQHGGRLFVALEFVEGVTLAQWLGERRRSKRQVLEAFLAAGRGLAAAHAAGLVHRDFKPENVLVADDGRVRVVDFSLARTAPKQLGEKTTDAGGGPRPERLPELTRTGEVLGTPDYMAPEQHLGLAADARSDQFSFCVALYEALYGERPYEGRSTIELVGSIETGKVRPAPRGARVPGRLRALLLRGLSPEPRNRFASMDVLLAALGREPRRWARNGAMAAAAVLALSTGGVLAARQAGERAALCRGGERQIEPAWNAARRQAVEAALLRTGAPYAGAAAREVVRVLDGYSARWVEQHVEACEATRVRGEQSEEVLGLRMACLDERRSELKALTDRLVEADRGLAERAVQATFGLSELEACTDTRALASPLRPPPGAATKPEIERLRAKIAETRALLHSAKYREGLEASRSLAERAKQLRYRPFEAEALFLVGEFSDELADYDEASRAFEQAALSAEAGRHDELAARALTKLLWVQGGRQARYDQVELFSQRVGAVLERLGNPAELEAQQLLALGRVGTDRGRYREAERDLERAVGLLESKYGGDDLRLAEPLILLARIAGLERHTPKARAYLERALAIRRRALGDEHPDVGYALQGIGNAQGQSGEYAEAVATFGRAVAVFERALGPEHPRVAGALHDMALVYLKQGRAPEAVTLMRRVVAIEEKALGPDHPTRAFHLGGLATALEAEGKRAEALAMFERVHALLRKHFGEDHPTIARTLQGIGYTQMKLGRLAEAREAIEKSDAMFRRVLGEGYAGGEVLQTLGEIYLRLGQPEQALGPLTSALRLHGQYGEEARQVAVTKSLLAKALWETGRDRAQAGGLAREAHAHMKADPSLVAECADFERWMQKKSLL